MSTYTAITFSPVQGFIEKSRKLRDLYGASLILSYLSKKLVDQAQQLNIRVISPGLPNIAKGMPNRILIQGDFPQEQVIETLRTSWKKILKECKDCLERNVSVTQPDIYYHWDRDWEMWGVHTDDHERLSIPELVKRLITLPNTGIPQKFRKEDLPFIEKFTELQRKPEPENNKVSQWTGWFMGDGDKVGDYLKKLQTPEEITTFSEAMRNWGKKFQQEFEQQNLGRVIYAGGDDFLGVFFDSKPTENSSEELKKKAIEWLLNFKDKWAEHGQDITVSVGFVWVAVGLERFWGEHLRLQGNAQGDYWRDVWQELVKIMKQAGVNLPNDPVNPNDTNSIKNMTNKLWSFDQKQRKVALAVLTQLCDSLVWWTQRYKQ
jgi:hypothetical protein